MSEEPAKTILDHLVTIYTVSIWPLTFLFLISWFKKEFKHFLGNLKTLKASSSGVEITAFQKGVEDIREDSINDITPKGDSVPVHSDKFDIFPSLSNAAQIKVWNDVIMNRVRTKSGDMNIDNDTAFAKNLISSKELKLLKLQEDLPNNISKDIVRELQKYYIQAYSN